MPRPTYGPEVKRRTAALFALLLDYANDELEADEKTLDSLRSHLQCSWQSDQRLVVRTKVRSLLSLSKLSSNPLTSDQIKESLRRLADFLEILEDNRPSTSGSETWHFTLKLWCHRRDRTALLNQFDQIWESRRSKPATPAEIIDPWVARCESLLTTNLTTNPLTVRDRISFEWRSLYVPLGIIPRPGIPQLSPNDPEPEQPEIPQSPDQFLGQLLEAESQCRIAIVGEPGTGKTTLLQNLALGLVQAQQLPIWVSLADLQETNLEEFLLNEWLKTATRQFRITPEIQDNFAMQVQQGRVWLLLDAIDEMVLDSSVALGSIARQLRGWLGDSHVILTCRSHVWDSGKNGLEEFESFSNLSFQDQMQPFIQQWFSHQPEAGDRLYSELTQSNQYRIRDMVKNPLCLALLCRTWSVHQGFPTTKSMLYQQFVEALYDWKQDRMPTSLGNRQQLNRALGELAIVALLNRQTKFRLSHSFILKTWQDQAAKYLPLALNLGWLTQVGIQSGSGEKMYAFYHPTFQEYFAAQAIEDWQILGKNWRTQLLESQWRGVVLFWLGRINLEEAPKQDLINALSQLEDQTGLYRPRAYFLIAAGLAEFPESSIAHEIAAQLMQWRFGHYNEAFQVWQWYPQILQTKSQSALIRMDRSIAVTAYESYLNQQLSFFARWQAAYSLGNAIEPQHPLAISILRELINEAEDDGFKIRICEALIRINSDDELAITMLRAILKDTKKDKIRRKAAHVLVRIMQDEIAIETLEKLVQTAEPTIQRQSAESLGQLLPEHPLGIIKQTSPKKRKVARGERSKESITHEVNSLLQKLQNPHSINARIRYADRLGQLAPGHPAAVQNLLFVLKEPEQQASVYRSSGDRLIQILTDEHRREVMTQLYSLIPNDRTPYTAQTSVIYGILWNIVQDVSYESLEDWDQFTYLGI